MNVLSLSYGKDSLACLGACEQLGIKIDRIVHAEVWATDTIPADLPPMVEFKKKADKIIKERYGIEVEHYRADETYESQFYKIRKSKIINGHQIYGFPIVRGAWCNDRLKMAAVKKCNINKHDVQLVGIAVDEPNRFKCLNDKKYLPLLKPVGQKLCAESGVRKTIYYHPYTPQQQEAVVGSVIIKA